MDVDEAVTTETRVNTTAPAQAFASVAMTPDGDMVVVWQGNGVGDQNGIFFRRYNESTDTAGPLVTGFALPDGTAISSGGTVAKPVQSAIVTFDEALDPTTATSLDSYSVFCNGVEVVGAIKAVYYTGRDTAYNLSGALRSQYGITIGQTNKYQVVLVFLTVPPL